MLRIDHNGRTQEQVLRSSGGDRVGLPSSDWYYDYDGDGFGDPASGISSTYQQDDYVTDDSDCADGDANVNPDATEVYGNDVDENCDGEKDEGFSAFYRDQDADTYGAGTARMETSAPAGYASRDGDCNDLDSAMRPGATDLRGDGIDQDCSGADTAAAPSTVNYQGSSQGVWTNKNKTVNFSAVVASSADCLIGRRVTFTVNGVTKSATTGATGAASVAYTVTTWQTGVTYPIVIAPLPASSSTGGACAGDSDGATGNWSYGAVKPPKK